MTSDLESRIRVLIVDDSSVMRRIIINALEKQPEVEVIGTAANGKQAIDLVNQLRPDLITLDIEMPEMDGLTALREIRKVHKRMPIIMFSTLTHKGAQAAVMALTAGATDYVGKPTTSAGSIEGAFKVLEDELIPKVIGLGLRVKRQVSLQPIKTVTEAKPINPVLSASQRAVENVSSIVPKIAAAHSVTPASAQAVVIGISTGGPMALMHLFSAFKAVLPVPVFVVQHMPPTFTTLLAARLTTAGLMTVKEPEEGEMPEAGTVYMAPGGFHMKLVREGAKVVMRLTTEPPENSCRPAADVLFRSAAAIYESGLLAVVMTGMGQDGLKGCQEVKRYQGQVIAQDEASSVIWGMPQAVVKQGLADTVLPLNDIADEIVFRTRTSATRVAKD